MDNFPAPTMNDLQQQQFYHPYSMQPPSTLCGMPITPTETVNPSIAPLNSPTGTSSTNLPQQYAIPHPSVQEMMGAYSGASLSPSTSSPQPQHANFNPLSGGICAGAAGPIRKRRFSSAKIQPTRVKKVMQSDEEIGRMVASVPVAIGRAMEHFAEKFLLASASAVAGTNGRTLSPYHMKLAMMANPHFAFLEPILRDICVPAKQAENIPYNVCQVPSPISSPCIPNPTSIPLAATSSMAIQSTAMSAYQNTLPVQKPAPVSQRRQSNGQKPELAPGEKPKRGRPRKIKKEEKLIDDELADVPTETELMPPPMLPPLKMPSKMKPPMKVSKSASPLPPSLLIGNNANTTICDKEIVPTSASYTPPSNVGTVESHSSSSESRTDDSSPSSPQNENIPNGMSTSIEEKPQ